MAAPEGRYLVSVERVVVGPDDLAVQLPARARVLRTVPGADRPDYSLAALPHPLRLRSTVQALSEAGVDVRGLDLRTSTVHDDGSVVALVYALALAPRLAGVVLAQATEPVEVATALVLDPSQMADRSLHLSKVLYTAITSVTVASAGSTSVVPSADGARS